MSDYESMCKSTLLLGKQTLIDFCIFSQQSRRTLSIDSAQFS